MYIVQLASPDHVEHVISSWDPSTFGGSAIRKTIRLPDSDSTGLIKDILLDISNDEIDEALAKSYKNTSFKQLTKNGQRLRTIKATFADNKQLQDANSNGLLLVSHNDFQNRTYYQHFQTFVRG
jgi:hypothetical protein